MNLRGLLLLTAVGLAAAAACTDQANTTCIVNAPTCCDAVPADAGCFGTPPGITGVVDPNVTHGVGCSVNTQARVCVCTVPDGGTAPAWDCTR